MFGQHSVDVGEGSGQGCCHGVIFCCVMCHGSFAQVASSHLRGLGSVLGHWWTSGIAAGCCLCTSVVLRQYYHVSAPDSFIHLSTMVYVIYNGPTNALVCNKTLIQMPHTKTFKITPTYFDHQMIIIRELFDPG
jgi:hypothetical protein